MENKEEKLASETQTAPQEVVQVPPQRSELPKKKHRLNIALAAITIFSLGATAFFVYQNFQLRKEQTNLTQNISTSTPTPIPEITTKTYTDDEYGFSFNYPQSWQMSSKEGPDNSPTMSFTNISEGHVFTVDVWRVTGFGYCYQYGDRREITVGGKNAETADGIGGSEMCDEPEKYENLGNTYFLIPLEGTSTLPQNQIHISYTYPLDDKNLAKSNLDQILSTFKFTNQDELENENLPTTNPNSTSSNNTWNGLGVTFSYANTWAPEKPVSTIQKPQEQGFYQQGFKSVNMPDNSMLLKVEPREQNASGGYKTLEVQYNLPNIEKVQIAGKEGVKAEYASNNLQQYFFGTLLYENTTVSVMFWVQNPTSESKTEAENTYNQILSTFDLIK